MQPHATSTTSGTNLSVVFPDVTLVSPGHLLLPCPKQVFTLCPTHPAHHVPHALPTVSHMPCHCASPIMSHMPCPSRPMHPAIMPCPSCLTCPAHHIPCTLPSRLVHHVPHALPIASHAPHRHTSPITSHTPCPSHPMQHVVSCITLVSIIHFKCTLLIALGS